MKSFLCSIVLSCCFCALLSQPDQTALNNELETLFNESDLPGLAISIVNGEEVLYEKAFGYADKAAAVPFTLNTRMAIGSVSKTLVGLAVVKLIEEGKLDWDMPINELLPYKITNPYYPENPILLSHLLNHTSSILDGKNYGHSYVLDERNDYTGKEGVHEGFLGFLKSHADMTFPDFVRETLTVKGKWYKKKNFLKALPGTERAYSNLNAVIAAYLVEIASGQSYQEYTREHIFTPLSLEASGWEVDEPSETNGECAEYYFPSQFIVPRYRLVTFPDGGWITTNRDLSRYLQDIIRGYEGNSGLLSAESYQLLLPGDSDEKRAFWGIGTKSRNIGHTGSDPGVHCEMNFNADTKIGVIMMTNVNAEDNEELWQQFSSLKEAVNHYVKQIPAEE